MSSVAVKAFSNKLVHRRRSLWIARVALLVVNDWSGASIKQKGVDLQIVLIVLLNASIVSWRLLPFDTGSLCHSCSWSVVIVGSMFEIFNCRSLAFENQGAFFAVIRWENYCSTILLITINLHDSYLSLLWVNHKLVLASSQVSRLIQKLILTN